MATKRKRGAAKPKTKAKGATSSTTGKGQTVASKLKKSSVIRATAQEAKEVEEEIRESLEGVARGIDDQSSLIVYRNRNGTVDADLSIKIDLEQAKEENQALVSILTISENLNIPRKEEIWFTVRLHFIRYNWAKKRLEHIVKYSDPTSLTDGKSVLNDRYATDTIQMNWRLGMHAPAIMWALTDPYNGVVSRVVTKYSEGSSVSVHLSEIHLKMHWNKARKRPFKGR